MDETELFTIEEETERERVLTFMEYMYGRTPPSLRLQEEEARAEGVPVIRPQTRQSLAMFLLLTKPRNILEIGSATGFSAGIMRHYAPGARITGIEIDPERCGKARERFADDPMASFLRGDALELVPTLAGPFDFVFLDAAKGQYARLYPLIRERLAPGGVLFADNCLRGSQVTDSRFAVTRRNRTIHERLRAFLRMAAEDGEMDMLLLQEGDGICVCRRKDGAQHSEEDGI